jgi:hypothetical protein
VIVYSGQEFTRINPMESFFVEAAEGTSVTVNFTESMIGNGLMHSMMRAPRRTAAFNELRISATCNGITAGTLLLDGVDASAPTLIDEDAAPKLAVFTILNGHGYDIQSLNAQQEIPLGIYLPTAGTVTLSFSASDGIDLGYYELLDIETGETYSLEESNEFELQGTSIGRFYLVNKNTFTNVDEMLSMAQNVSLNVLGDVATVTSAGDDIVRVEVISADGRIMNAVDEKNVREASIKTIKGVNVIVVYRNGMKPRVFKILN